MLETVGMTATSGLHIPLFCPDTTNIILLISGAIFEQGTAEIQSAFQFSLLGFNQNITGRKFELQAFVDVINTADAFKLSRLSEYNFFSSFLSGESSWNLNSKCGSGWEESGT